MLCFSGAVVRALKKTDHPVTPPPELVQQWRNAAPLTRADQRPLGFNRESWIAIQAARWGADQELLACGKYLEQCAAWEPEDVTEMYNSRRPQPEAEGPNERIISIAKAVQECAFSHKPDVRLIGNVCAEDVADLCNAVLDRALEQLDD